MTASICLHYALKCRRPAPSGNEISFAEVLNLLLAPISHINEALTRKTAAAPHEVVGVVRVSLVVGLLELLGAHLLHLRSLSL